MPLILIVDDEPSIRMLVARVLSTADFDTLEAANGAQALELVAAHEPALVVLDLSMPGLNGLQVCRLVKENPFTARVPILMLTAQDGLDDKLQGFDAGADDYLGKPFEPRELTARVRALLRLVRREADRNPSSGLPGGAAIGAELERRAHSGQAFAVCYFDIDFFKPFADTFGFSVADQIIARGGDALRGASHASDDAPFVGHIGGDDFISIGSCDGAEPFARDVLHRFDALVREVVCALPGGEAVCEQRIFAGADRDGLTREFPLIRLSAAVVVVEPGSWVSPAHLGAFASGLKRQVKKSGEGVLSGALV